jgi:hypothetical protein
VSPLYVTEGATSPFAADEAMRTALREPFPPEQIGKLPATQKRPAQDFVGHAAVTDRLNMVASDWSYTVDELFNHGGDCWIRGTMTIGGISRPEYGDGSTPKEAIGNFIRRGAMRFGVALDLWSREELTANLKASAETTDAASSPASGKQAPSEPKPPASADGGPTPDLSVGQGAPPNLSSSEAAPADSGGDSSSSGSNAQTRGTASPTGSGPGGQGEPSGDERPEGTSSAAPNAAGTEAGGARQEPDSYGEGETGTEGSPQPPTSRRDQLWKNLVEFAGTKKKALNAVNQTMKASWTELHIGDIPEDDIENTLRAFMQREGVA